MPWVKFVPGIGKVEETESEVFGRALRDAEIKVKNNLHKQGRFDDAAPDDSHHICIERKHERTL